MFDAVIIGSGYGGMSVAALLNKAGLKVLVLESASIIGGRAASFKDNEGYTWEYGAHSHRLREKGIADQVFKRLGDEIKFVAEGKSLLIFKSKLWDRPEGPLGFLTTPIFSLWGRINLLLFLLRIKQSDPFEWYDKTLWQFYRTGYLNEEVESFLPFLGLTVMCPDPHKVSAGEVIRFLQRVLEAKVGVGEPIGGSYQIFEKLQKHILNSKSESKIHLGEQVIKIIIENREVKGVLTQKDKYESKCVIYAARLNNLFETADKTFFKNDFINYCENIEYSSGLSIDFIMDKQFLDVKGGILGADIPIWAKFQSNFDESFAPKGRYLSTWGIMLPWNFNGDLKEVSNGEKRLRETISSLFPDFFTHVIKERKLVAPVMNGNVLTPKQSWPNRPDINSESVKGLYFVGDTVKGDGCSGDISFSSAMKASDMILKK